MANVSMASLKPTSKERKLKVVDFPVVKCQLQFVWSQYCAKMAKSIMLTSPLSTKAGSTSVPPHHVGNVQPDWNQWFVKMAKSARFTIPSPSGSTPPHLMEPVHTIDEGSAKLLLGPGLESERQLASTGPVL